MATDAPAFDFYPERWIAGTIGMTDAEELCYFRLVLHSWLQSGLPDDPEKMARLARMKSVPADVLEKFPVAEDGKRRNPFQERLRIKQRERITAAKEKAVRMAQGRWKDHVKHSTSNAQACHQALHDECPPPTSHLPPRSSPSPARNGVVSGDPPSVDDVLAYAKGNAAGTLRTDVCMAWMDARQRDGWKLRKDGHSYEFEDWRADLRGFHRIFLENEGDKKARGNGRTPQPSRLTPSDPTKPKPAF